MREKASQHYFHLAAQGLTKEQARKIFEYFKTLQ